MCRLMLTHTPISHCNTCKELSGATYTLNQIIPAKALNITKGSDLGKYTYKGDSGTSPRLPLLSRISHHFGSCR